MRTLYMHTAVLSFDIAVYCSYKHKMAIIQEFFNMGYQ